ncbi:hypothetical protein LY76DRAFT_592121 [Colletotrichum caudatum]|nr:hypothetical protein LY76DRAFT_592121 [Colletotrichum caudatum]
MYVRVQSREYDVPSVLTKVHHGCTDPNCSQERGGARSPVRSNAGRAGPASDPFGDPVRKPSLKASPSIQLHPSNHVNTTLNSGDLPAPFPFGVPFRCS